MREKIPELIRQGNNATILFAVESGSRAWGIESQDSDYDVRYVYHHSLTDYLQLFSRIDETKEQFHDLKEDKIDLVGWDIYKFLRLLGKSNPTTIEWIMSPITYIDHPVRDRLKKIIQNFSRFRLILHYQSMALRNYRTYIETNNHAELIKWLYVIRSLLNAIYILETDELPPMSIDDTITLLSKANLWDVKLMEDDLRQLLQLKRENIEQTNPTVGSSVKFWITETFDHLDKEVEMLAEHHKEKNISKQELELVLEEILQYSKD